MEAHATSVGGGRPVLGRSPLSRLPDQILQFGLAGIAAGVLVLLAAFVVRARRASPRTPSATSASSTSCSATTGRPPSCRRGPRARPATGARSARGRCSSGTLLTAGIALVDRRPDRGRHGAVPHRAVPAARSARRSRSSSTCSPLCRPSSTGCGASSCSRRSCAASSSGSPTRSRSCRSRRGRSPARATSSPGSCSRS